MHSDTLTFIDSLFGRCTSPEQTFITLTAMPPDRSRYATPSRHIVLADRDRLIQALECLVATNHLGWGACVAVAPRRTDLGRYHRGGKLDLLELPALFVDVDRPLAEVAELDNFPVPPSCIVSSGLGIHLYWYLKEPTHAFDQADRALRRLTKL